MGEHGEQVKQASDEEGSNRKATKLPSDGADEDGEADGEGQTQGDEVAEGRPEGRPF